MKAIQYLKQNALGIAAFFGFSGATLFALLGEGSCMAAEYPAPAAALAVAALCLGACIGNAVAKRRARKELQAERGRLEAENSSLNAAHAEQLAAMRAEFDSRLASLRAEYDESAKEAAASKAKAAKLDKLARTFSCMPEASKELVAEALDNGECIVTVADMPRLNAAAALAEKGIFWSPRTASDRFPIHISPEYVTEIREHRSEWLGM